MRALRLSLKLLAATALMVLALAGALWLWSGTDSSLATLLTRLQRFLPADQTLEAKDVKGSLQGGGHIGWLRWRRGDLSVEAQDISVAWTLGPLFNKQLRLSALTMASLTIDDRRINDSNTPPAPPTSLTLPITIDVPFKVAAITWTGATTLQATEVSGHYTYDSYSHILDKGLGHISSGNYQFSGALQATAPMALTLQVNGQVTTTVPSNPKPLTVTATAKLTGELSTPQAVLALQATLTPDLPAGPATRKAAAEAMQASLSASIQPWQAQPVRLANAQWHALNLAALWPQAPQTLLSGEASVVPAGDAWQAKVNLSNTLPGPWNQQRLPLNTLQADVDYKAPQWLLRSVQATGAGGSVTGSGQFNASLWQGTASLQGLNPAAMDTRLANGALGGKLEAEQAADGIRFTAQLAADPAKLKPAKATPLTDSLQALKLQSLQTQGLWAAPLLTLSALHIDAQEAQLQGKLTFQSVTQATQAQLALTLPGAHGTLDGHLASDKGQGSLAFDVTNADLTAEWLTRWPVVANALQGTRLGGAAQLQANWKGGWQQQGKALQLDAKLRTPLLNWRNNPNWPNTPVALTDTPQDGQLRDAQVDLSGTLTNLNLSTQGQAGIGTRQLNWQAQASGGQLGANHWQGSLNTLTLRAQDAAQPGLWTLTTGNMGMAASAASKVSQASQTITVNWLQSGATQTISVSGGSAQLTGPLPGTAHLSWLPAQWSQQQQKQLQQQQKQQPQQKLQQTQAARQAKPNVRWHSQGSISQLPLAWLDAISGKSMADLGLSSDLILAGNWDAKHTDTLHLSALLERSSGDLRLSTDASQKQLLPARMQEARLNVNLDGEQLSSSLRWDSERAGRVLLALSTQLQVSQAWAWAEDAPLGGSLQMQLPPVNAWSALAPPGWRLRGTLDAHATLTGTRKSPQWRGTLQAKDLAVRSVADGIDFQKGTLTARLDGQQLTLEDFTLYGAGGPSGTGDKDRASGTNGTGVKGSASNKSNTRDEGSAGSLGSASGSGSAVGTVGGVVKVTGTARLQPAGKPSDTVTQRVQITLAASAKALRISTRSDRRITVSGDLTAHLKDAALTLRGKLVADQALLTLPSESAPVLGDDVVVRPSATQAVQDALAKKNVPAKTSPAKPPANTITQDLHVTLDLGPSFQVRGRGLDTRLAGKLDVRAAGSADPSLTGTVRTVRGTYQAYGQRLDIEQGLLRFYGPADNPALDILAIRPKITQRVGVQVLGTALSPIVRLYAEPELPEAEKLAWLVLGRSASGSGGEAALLQQAALALLGGSGQGPTASLTQALGLDELSFSGSSGDSASGATVTLGKRLSNDFYVAYESSLTGAMGIFTIFYDLSRRLTLRAQTGENSAIDLIWTHRYD